MNDLCIPKSWIEIREAKDFDTGGMRLMATIRFAVATVIPQEALQDCADAIAQAALVRRVQHNLARELSEHPLAHRVEAGAVVEMIDVEKVRQ